MKVCYLVGAGPAARLEDFPQKGDCVLAVDGGYETAKRLGLCVDGAVGDFDSLGYIPADVPVERHPVHKDETDMLLAARIGLARGYRRFLLLGGCGGRLDHTLANLQTLLYLTRRGAQGVMTDEHACLTTLENGALRFAPREKGLFSVFALGGHAEGVTLEGLLYPLEEASLTPDFPLGVSNEWTGDPVCVRVREGALLLCWEGTERDLLCWRLEREGEKGN